MNARERFQKTFRFEETDRPFRWETPGAWPATVKRWLGEGLPLEASGRFAEYFCMDKLVWLRFPGGWTGNPYCPRFEKKVLGSDEYNVTLEDTDGILKKQRILDPDTSMPQFLKFPVETPCDYEEKILPRMDWRTPERFPADWEEIIAARRNRDYPLGMFVIGPFGFLRNLLGDENLMYMLFDEPAFIHRMMADWKEFYMRFIPLVCRDVVPDFLMVWEDICYSRGPLVSPSHFMEFMAPGLKDVILNAKNLGIEAVVVDTDGDCSKMIPIYLECGANGFYPFEVQAGMDIVEWRKRYPREFVVIGGLDKKTLAKSREHIMEEVRKKVPFMVAQKGFIPMLDHTVPPDVSLSNFEFFLEDVRNISRGI
ncbi:MAG: uroporphyrinogen decarboxylase family protein [Clostridia bacterium]